MYFKNKAMPTSMLKSLDSIEFFPQGANSKVNFIIDIKLDIFSFSIASLHHLQHNCDIC